MIYITGDTHGDFRKLSKNHFTNQKNMTKKDYVIICGDCGLIWDNSPTQKYWIKWLSDRSFTILFVDGNHENFEILNSIPVEEWNGGKIHKISDNIFHLMRGQVFEIEDKKFFTFGGAESVDKYMRVEHISWWKEELPNCEEYNEALKNLEKHNNKIDYILTHTCPENVLKILSDRMTLLKTIDGDINKFFSYVEKDVKFKHWFFGHFHEDINIDDKHTLMYNKMQLL